MEEKYYYSALENAFYPHSLRDSYSEAGSWPQDAVIVSEDVFNEFAIAEPPDGKVRVPGENGRPTWGDIPPPTAEEAIMSANTEKSRLMSDAEAIIAPLQRAVKYAMATDEEKALLERWEVYTVLLSRVDTSKAPDIEWPSLP